MSSAIIDQDRSSTSMMSTPLACVSVWSLAKRGPASATMHKATVEQPQEEQQPAGGGRARPRPAARAMSALGKRSAASLPMRPRRKA